MKNNTQKHFEALNLKDGERVLVPYTLEAEAPVICDVCGAENEKDSELCKMCSNYLK